MTIQTSPQTAQILAPSQPTLNDVLGVFSSDMKTASVPDPAPLLQGLSHPQWWGFWQAVNEACVGKNIHPAIISEKKSRFAALAADPDIVSAMLADPNTTVDPNALWRFVATTFEDDMWSPNEEQLIAPLMTSLMASAQKTNIASDNIDRCLGLVWDKMCLQRRRAANPVLAQATEQMWPILTPKTHKACWAQLVHAMGHDPSVFVGVLSPDQRLPEENAWALTQVATHPHLERPVDISLVQRLAQAVAPKLLGGVVLERVTGCDHSEAWTAKVIHALWDQAQLDSTTTANHATRPVVQIIIHLAQAGMTSTVKEVLARSTTFDSSDALNVARQLSVTEQRAWPEAFVALVSSRPISEHVKMLTDVCSFVNVMKGWDVPQTMSDGLAHCWHQLPEPQKAQLLADCPIVIGLPDVQAWSEHGVLTEHVESPATRAPSKKM